MITPVMGVQTSTSYTVPPHDGLPVRTNPDVKWSARPAQAPGASSIATELYRVPSELVSSTPTVSPAELLYGPQPNVQDMSVTTKLSPEGRGKTVLPKDTWAGGVPAA